MSTDDRTRILPGRTETGVGTQLSGIYELDERIASGGMGEVYRGHNIQTGDLVAIKIVLPEFARDQTRIIPETTGRSSARNRFVGLVTHVTTDKVMAQVDMQCGPFRIVSLMSSESVRDLGLEPGSVAVAVIKSTTVIVETLEGAS